MSEIKNWYTGKNVLITGATGFIGKVVVERLLRDCDEVNSIYLIVRAKKNFSARCQEYLNHIVFDHLRASKPEQLEKIKILESDLTQENLGLTSTNIIDILDNIDIVFHIGADIRFDVSLREIFNTNTIGTYRLLELAKQMKNLQVFVFVSTTYSQSNHYITEERHYDALIDALTLMKTFEKFDDRTMLALQPKILKEFPNTYSFSKHLTEDLVNRYRNEFTICIVRPSIVSAACIYPIVDYNEGLNGFNGWHYAYKRGVLRTTYANLKAPIQTIPVDYLANTIIATSWIHGAKKMDHIQYYNANMPTEIMATYVEAQTLEKEIKFDYPLNYSLWSPNQTCTKCVYYYWLRTFFYQILPSIILDFLIWIFKRKPIMLKIQRKIYHGISTIAPYLEPMKFETDNFRNIPNFLNQVDRKIFYTSSDNITLRGLQVTNARSIRKFIAKEKEEDLPRARMYNLIWYWIHIAMKTIIAIYLIKFAFIRVF